MALNPLLILAGDKPDLAGSVFRANKEAFAQGQRNRTNALQTFQRDQGAALTRGDQGALDQFAQFDPAASFQFRGAVDERARVAQQRQAAAAAGAQSARQKELAGMLDAGDVLISQGEEAFNAGIARLDPDGNLAKNGINFQNFTEFSAALRAKEGISLPAQEFVTVNGQRVPKGVGGDFRDTTGGGAIGFAIDTEILADGSTIQATSTGDVIVKNPAGDVVEGEDRLAVIQASQKSEGNLARLIAAEKAAGTASIKLSSEAFDTLGTVNENITNLNRAIALVDAGAPTGPLRQFLPNITANAVKLANLRKELALDVIGSVTFGALSKGELDLAQDVALPDALRPEDLKDWLVERRDAQQKYSNYLSEAASFLGTPGNTVPKWIAKQKADATARGALAPNTGQVNVVAMTPADIGNLTTEQFKQVDLTTLSGLTNAQWDALESLAQRSQ